MCTTCGCGQGETKIEGVGSTGHGDGPGHTHAPGDGLRWHRHGDGPLHHHSPDDGLDALRRTAAAGPLGAVHAPGVSPARIVAIERDILAKNDREASANRQLFADRALFVLNLVSSPGSGKTSLLVRTIEALGGRVPVAVIEGDQQTTRDADRIRTTGVPAVQVNTGKGCHLDAQMVGRAYAALRGFRDGLLFIENVGNLVCPAAFDLGEAHKVVILSVTEGEDKPLKYPDMFHAADLLLINKIDLSPHVEFDADAAIGYARRVRPDLPVMRVSATTGEGFDAWLDWLQQGAAAAKASRDRDVDALRRRVSALETELAQRTEVAPAR